MIKVIASNAVGELVHDDATIYTCGFGLAGYAEEVAIGIKESFLATGHPRNLTVYHAAGIGNCRDRGIQHFAKEGLLKRIVAGHFGVGGQDINQLIIENRIEAYNLPQGVLTLMPRNIAGKRPGLITKVGLGTFVDPRVEGGKITNKAVEDLVQVVEFDAEEWLYYKAPKVDVAIIRGSIADEDGNLTLHREGILLETISVAQAAKACGGIVIAQVEHIVKAGSLHPKMVKVPGLFVDYLVVAKPENHYQTMGTYFNPAFAGDIKVPVDSIKPLEMDERKIIARRAAMELVSNAAVNLGIGMPEGIAGVAAEEKVDYLMTLTTEAGMIGGIPAGGLDFGHGVNAEAVIEMAYQFDFYDGGGIDVGFLGLAQMDRFGNINVSKFGPKTAGCGGFINITQTAKKVVYCGTFTAGGLKVKVENSKLVIVQEGKNKKFLQDVEQITFSGKYAAKVGQPVLYVTERAVFQLTAAGVELIEVAPGIDIEKDILQHMDFKPIINQVKQMDPAIFQEIWGGLAAIINAHS
ncbi:CoA-transferase [Anaerosporomusa subterranea]|uniref:CoA-transferase n=1 Tax=Anaerosporomusa subterranea TaxID=1794912 RepID=A0A154BP57_ANASB|nr:CoA-transferase [Anaerosporomusa subterranea]KYZ75679.1 CoA-transferase [Anaerosporomusa subterranea]